MTPTNTTMSPEIKNIMDNEDVKHTVVPTPHTHSRDEVDGLVDALANKADVRHSHDSIYETKGYQTAVVETVKDPSASDTTYIQLGFQDDREEEFYQYARISLANLNNLKRALLNPDSTPTANSDNLVTSGGVKAAIDDATKAVFGSMPYYITAAHEKMYVHTRILRNNTGATIKLSECIDVSALPAAERHVYWNSPDIDLPNNTEIGIRFVRASNAIFLYYDGNFDY